MLLPVIALGGAAFLWQAKQSSPDVNGASPPSRVPNDEDRPETISRAAPDEDASSGTQRTPAAHEPLSPARTAQVEPQRVSELQLSPTPALGIVLSGRVLDEEGAPLVGARVNVQSRRPGSTSADVNARTDRAGEFRIADAPSGEVTVFAFQDGLRGARLDLGELAPREERHDLELVLATGYTLAGRVLDITGAPAARARLWIESQSDPGNGEVARADDQGRFQSTGLDAGPFRVSAWDELGDSGKLTTAFRVPADGQELELRLAPPAALELVVPGSPSLADVRVVLLDLDGFALEPSPYAPSPEEGRPRWTSRATSSGLELGGLAAGEYWVGLQDLEHGRAGWTRVALTARESARAELVLVPATWLRVTGADALVVRGAEGFTERLVPEVGRATSSQERSVFLPSGTYRIESTSPNARAATEVILAGEPERHLRFE